MWIVLTSQVSSLKVIVAVVATIKNCATVTTITILKIIRELYLSENTDLGTGWEPIYFSIKLLEGDIILINKVLSPQPL